MKSGLMTSIQDLLSKKVQMDIHSEVTWIFLKLSTGGKTV